MPRRGEADRVIPNPLHDGLRPWVWRQRCFLCDNGASASSFFVGIYERSGMKAPLIADCIYEIIIKNAARLDSEIIYDRDFNYDYFGFKTLERSFLLKVQGKVLERLQHMLMRVAVGIHNEDIDSAVKTYHLMSQRGFTHASPTLFNAGTPTQQVLEDPETTKHEQPLAFS